MLSESDNLVFFRGIKDTITFVKQEVRTLISINLEDYRHMFDATQWCGIKRTNSIGIEAYIVIYVCIFSQAYYLEA